MSFRSDISNYDVIDDSTDLSGEDHGLIPRDFDDTPHGSLVYAAPFNIPLIPREEWKERIEERERAKARIVDLCEYKGLTPLHQGNTNYCWANGVVHAVEIMRILQGLPLVRLSPASVGGPITGFRNVGGWGSQALKYIAEHGICTQEKWPANAIDRRYDTAESRAERANYQIDEWWDLQPRNFDQLVSCLLQENKPVSAARNRWKHLTTDIGVVLLDPNSDYRNWPENGGIGILTSNSGYGRDRRGFTVLKGSMARADEQLAPRLVTAS